MKNCMFAVLLLSVVGCSNPSGAPTTELSEETISKPDDSLDNNELAMAESKTEAASVLAAAIATASQEDKRVLVHLGAPW